MKKIIIFSVLILNFNLLFSQEHDFKIELLTKLFNSEKKDIAELFDLSFKEKVSIDKTYDILNSYKRSLGKQTNVIIEADSYNIIFEKGAIQSKIYLNDNNKIIGLWFGPIILFNLTIDSILSEFKKIPGNNSLSIFKNNNSSILSYNEDEPLAVGSSFKLLILKLIYKKITDKKINWNDIIILKKNNKSIQSGILQDWPDNTPLTLKTLAALMISISDNTAADILIDYLGREEIEKNVSDINKPFLKTKDFFILKFSSDINIYSEYMKSKIQEKRKILETFNNKDISDVKINSKPTDIDKIEWFFSTKDLCNLIYGLKDSDEIKINLGAFINKKDWYIAGYKGGYEPGVLQYTFILEKNKGDNIYTISATVNNKNNAVDNNKINELMMNIISQIKENKI